MEEKNIILNIKYKEGNFTCTILLDVRPLESIKNCKIKVEKKYGFPSSKQIFIFDGIELEDDKTLKDYSITNNSVIMLVNS